MDARKAKSRAAIVAAFSELLREEDYSKITVGDIIARAHVGRATFYGLFKSKDDLLAELVLRYLHPCPRRLTVRPLDGPTRAGRAYPQQPLGAPPGRPSPRSRRRAHASSPTAYARPSCHEQPKPSPPTKRPAATMTEASYYTT